MEDARAVLDAVGLQRAHVMGWSEGGPLAVLLTVTHPERVQSLVLYGTQSCFARKDDYPWGSSSPTRLRSRLPLRQRGAIQSGAWYSGPGRTSAS